MTFVELRDVGNVLFGGSGGGTGVGGLVTPIEDLPTGTVSYMGDSYLEGQTARPVGFLGLEISFDSSSLTGVFTGEADAAGI